MKRTPKSHLRPLLLAAAVTIALGVRPVASRAGSWSFVAFEGEGRSHVIVTAGGSDAEALPPVVEAFTRVVYSTAASGFARGLTLRTTFRLPGTERNGVLVIDLDRTAANEGWPGGRIDRLVARWYEVAPGGGPVRFDGEAESGALRSEGLAVDGELVGFRIGGELGFVDPGEDGIVGSSDDRRRTVEVVVESDPAPEAVRSGTGGLTTLPLDPVCDATVCWVDPGYGYYQEIYVPVGCEAEGYEPAEERVDGGCDGGSSDGAGGCEGDTYSEQDDGCGSDSWNEGSGSTGSGCSGDSGSGGGGDCGGSGGGGDCGGSGGGCTGDTF